MHWCQQVRQEVLGTANSATERLEANEDIRRLRFATEQTIDCVLLQSKPCASELRQLSHVV